MISVSDWNETRKRLGPIQKVVRPRRPWYDNRNLQGSSLHIATYLRDQVHYPDQRCYAIYDITHCNDAKSAKSNMKNLKCYNTVINESDYGFGAQYIAGCRFLALDLFFLGAMMPSSTTCTGNPT